MEKDGYTPTRFAEEVGVSRTYLQDVLSCRTKLKRRPDLIKLFAEKLNVPTSMLEYRETAGEDAA